jgi:hypothetical protein
LFLINFGLATAGTKTFTDQDLQQYQTPYKKEKPVLEDSSPAGKEEEQELKRYEVPYKAYEGRAKRIIIPVTFNGSVTASMVLDTGAPGMHISYRLAEKLGILDKDEGNLLVEEAIGGRTTWAVLTIIDTVQVDGATDHFVPTEVSSSLSEHFEGVIGMDFMANYSIHIDTKKHVVVFEERPQSPNMPAGHDETWWRTNFHRFASMRSEWKKYKEFIDNQRGDSERLKKLREFADHQFGEVDKLLNRLNGYAIDHAVPMEWREY